MTSPSPKEEEHQEVWVTKKQACKILGNLSERRTEEIVAKQGIEKKLEKRDGYKRPVVVYKRQQLVDYKASLTAPTLDAETGAIVKKERSDGAARGVVASFAPLLEALINRMPKPEPARYEWLTVEEAAAYVRLPELYLRRACRDGTLDHLGKGKGIRIRRRAIEDWDGKLLSRRARTRPDPF